MKINIKILEDVESSVKAFKNYLKANINNITSIDIKNSIRILESMIIDSSCIRSRLRTIKENTEQKQEEIYKTIKEIDLKIEILNAYIDILNDYLINRFSGYVS